MAQGDEVANNDNHETQVELMTSSLVNRAVGDSFRDERGVEWMKLRLAAKETKQKERNVRLWIAPDEKTGKSKVPGQQLEDRINAPWYVDIEALQTFLEERRKKQRAELAARLQVPVDEIPEDVEASEIVETVGNLPAITNAVSMVVDQIREINEDSRRDLAEQSSKIESILTDQLQLERDKNSQLEKEVVDLRVQLTVKEELAALGERRRWWRFFSAEA